MNAYHFLICDTLTTVRFEDEYQGARLKKLWQKCFSLICLSSAAIHPSIVIHLTSDEARQKTTDTKESPRQSLGVQVCETQQGFSVELGASKIDLHVATNLGTGTIDDLFWDRPFREQREFFLIVLLVLLRNYGLYGLHANAVVRDGVGVLIVGPSGAGKTTLTLSLMRDGWHYLSDDALMLRNSTRYVEALALRRGFSLTRKTVAFFPEILSPHTEDEYLSDGKLALEIESVFPGKHIAACVPRAIVFPQVTNVERSRLEPLDEMTALVNLIEQSPGIATCRSSTAENLGLLKALVYQATSHRLLIGADVLRDENCVSQMIYQCLASSSELLK